MKTKQACYTGAVAILLTNFIVLQPVLATQGGDSEISIRQIAQTIRRALPSQKRLDPRASKALEMYIPPRVSARPIDIGNPDQRHQNSVALHERIMETIKQGTEPITVLFGPAGAGKSSYGRFLEKQLWQIYDEDRQYIPVFIPL